MEELSLNKSSWKRVKFGDVAIQQKGKVDRENTDLTNYIKGEHMGSEDLHIRKWGNLTDEYLGPAFIRRFEKGDILYGSRRTYLRKVAIADFDGITSNTTFVIKANESKIDKRLLPFIMMSEGFTENSILNSKGSVNPYVNWKDLAKYEFLLPPKDQQARLGELLWAADEVVEKQFTLSNLISNLKNSILKDTFSISWDNDSKGFFKNFKKVDFQLIKFAEANFQSMFGPRFSGKLYNVNGNIASLRTTDLNNSGEINYDSIPKAQIDEDKFKDHYLKKGDLIISRSGTCGLAAVFNKFDIPVIPGAFLIRFRLKKEHNPEYFKIYFNSKIGRSQTSRITTGAVQKNLTSKALLSLKIPTPSKEIQDEFVTRFNVIENDFKIQYLNSVLELQKSLINQIF